MSSGAERDKGTTGHKLAPGHNPATALPAGMAVGEYRLEGVLGLNPYGVTYLASDAQGRKIVLKEFFPADLAVREGAAVRATTAPREDLVRRGRDRFLSDARRLQRIHHPSIVQVHKVFEAHNTAYMAVEYEPGETLEDVLATKHDFDDEARLRRFAFALIEALEEVHSGAFLHGKVDPSNIRLRDGVPVLLDFGTARAALALNVRAGTLRLAPGYAAIEQYTSHEAQGPWTDLYGLAATLYRVIAGREPLDAPARLLEDRMIPAVQAGGGRYSRSFLRAIDMALVVRPEDRPQTIAEWRPMLDPARAPKAQVFAEREEPDEDDYADMPAPRRPYWLYGTAAAGALVIGFAVLASTWSLFTPSRVAHDRLPLDSPYRTVDRSAVTLAVPPADDVSARETAQQREARMREQERQSAEQLRADQQRLAAEQQRARDAQQREAQLEAQQREAQQREARQREEQQRLARVAEETRQREEQQRQAQAAAARAAEEAKQREQQAAEQQRAEQQRQAQLAAAKAEQERQAAEQQRQRDIAAARAAEEQRQRDIAAARAEEAKAREAARQQEIARQQETARQEAARQETVRQQQEAARIERERQQDAIQTAEAARLREEVQARDEARRRQEALVREQQRAREEADRATAQASAAASGEPAAQATSTGSSAPETMSSALAPPPASAAPMAVTPSSPAAAPSAPPRSLAPPAPPAPGVVARAPVPTLTAPSAPRAETPATNGNSQLAAATAPAARVASDVGRIEDVNWRWGYLVLQADRTGLQVGDRVYARAGDQKLWMTIRRVSGSQVSAVPDSDLQRYQANGRVYRD
jgi:serine/threonine protein kinase